MKKFLPWILFGFVFSGVIIWQVGISKYSNQVSEKEIPPEYQGYEATFQRQQFTSLDGRTFDLMSLKSPIVVVNFWASWCIPCLDEMPSMLKLKKSLPNEKMSIVAINTDEDEQLKNIQKIQQKLNLQQDFIIVPDKNGTLTGLYNINAIPVTIIYLNGRVVHTSNGPMDFYSEEFREKVKEWLL